MILITNIKINNNIDINKVNRNINKNNEKEKKIKF